MCEQIIKNTFEKQDKVKVWITAKKEFQYEFTLHYDNLATQKEQAMKEIGEFIADLEKKLGIKRENL
jgi:hypothetical protein